jgi:diguanylate cyclase (GGDEF)-like protein
MSGTEHAAKSATTSRVRLAAVSPPDALARAHALVESYRGLADVFRDVLSEQSLDALLERIADTVGALVPYDELVIYEADAARRKLVAVLVRSKWAQEIVDDEASFGVGITGWAVANREPVHTNEAHLDPRVRIIQGTPVDPEALIVVPLIARGELKGALNIYRVGDDAEFDEDEFELAKRFGDAAALALDNAKSRAQLEHQAQTDALTGLLNHRYFHERLRAELQRASRSHLPVGLLMLDIDDFKRVNDIHGHAAGDDVLVRLADSLRGSARGSDVVCRIGGEEFAVILPETDSNSASQLAIRMRQRMAEQAFEGLGELTVSIGFAEGPADASNPRELVACAEAAMMTAKASGKNRIVHFGEGNHERPNAPARTGGDVRSIAHLKLLQSLSGKLNRLNDVREIGLTIANELRALLDYHNCRVFVVEGETIVPIAFRGELTAPASTSIDVLKLAIGEGITGHVVETGRPVLTGDAARCEFATPIPGTDPIDESLLAVPMHFGTRVIGAIVISKLGFDQFDGDDLRLLEVLAGQASVALENARLYEVQRVEAETARTLLEFARELATAQGVKEVLSRTVEQAARIFGSDRTSIWIEESMGGRLVPRALHGYGDVELVDSSALAAELPIKFTGKGEPFVVEAGGGMYVVAPLVFDDGTRACLAALLDRSDLGGVERPLRLLGGLAQQTKLAVANARSFDDLVASFNATVQSLTNAVHGHDGRTALEIAGDPNPSHESS